MKKQKICILMLSCLVLVACGKENAEETTKPNSELKANVHTSIEDVTYDQAIKEADLIAEVKIGKVNDIVEGGNNIVAKTKFEGSIEKVYAGNKKNDEAIYVLQEGKEGMEIEDYPLFQSGETYILMLVDSGDGKTFWIKGQVNGTYFVDGDATLKFGDTEPTLPEKKDISDLDETIIEKQEETANNSQVLDTEAFQLQLEKDVKE
ncbi:hypothetical protein DUK53_14670 [Listeria sp. SHR_NRA_18]|uniref:hypothetical protein n=1 Tax=Listeria TaxID=1637 RepID=UPI00051D28CF|nr:MULTISPECIES: hypothetical protein [Listeria]KGL43734.1 hypothetical protein EP56_07990 [Listeriaceae bacterium FSL A5-0209]KMT61750.1 hypothetical protein X559_1890 [Listeria newyorkensis]RQW65854.1 hypothetical protein DUK53_14670 [Listeria sp. SHR_NRA_18]